MEIAGAFGMNLPLRARSSRKLLICLYLMIIIHSATGLLLEV